MKHRPVICILDPDKERCLRQEKALDAAIAAKGLDAGGLSNFGGNHLERSGLERFPAIDVDGVCFTPKIEGELSYEILCDFLDMLLRKGLVRTSEDAPGEET